MPTRWTHFLFWASVPLVLLWTFYVWSLYLPHGVAGIKQNLVDLTTLPHPLVWKPWWFDLFIALGLVFAALSTGSWLLARLKVELSVGERLLLAPACGFLVLILAASSLGLPGLFKVGSLRVLIVLFLLAAVPGAITVCRLLGECAASFWKRLRAEPQAALYLAPAALFLFFGMATAALPEISFDALNGHLYYPRLFLQHGSFYLADLYRSNSPLYTQVLYSLGLALHGIGLARFLNFMLFPATALTVLLLAERLAESSRRLTTGALAMLFLVSAPAVLYHATICYPDLAQTFWGLLALYALFRYLDVQSWAWLGLCGAFAGMAAGSKYSGLYGVMVLGVLLSVGTWRHSWRDSWRDSWRHSASAVVVFSVIAVVIAAPWYIRNWYFTGDPLHPSLYRLMARPAIDPSEAAGIMHDAMNYLRLPTTAGNLLALPWLITLEGDRLQGTIGPVFLWALPVIAISGVISAHRKRDWWAMLFAAVALSLVFFIGPQWIRYFFPVVPLLCCLSAEGITSLGRGWLGLPALLLVLVNLPGLNKFWIGGGYNVMEEMRYDVAFGSVSFEQYQRKQVPGYETVQFWNHLPLAADTRILPVPVFEFFPPALSRWEVLDIFENRRIVCQLEKGVTVDCYDSAPAVLLRELDQHHIGMLAIRHNLEYMTTWGALRLEDPLLRTEFQFLDVKGGTFLYRRRPLGPNSGARYVNADLFHRWFFSQGSDHNKETQRSVKAEPYQPWGADRRVAIVIGPAADIIWDVDLRRQPRLQLSMSTTVPNQVIVRATSGSRSQEDVCDAEPSSGWEPCIVDLGSFAGTRVTLTLKAASIVIADPVIFANETGEAVTDSTERFPFNPSTHLVMVRFTPGKVRAGVDSYVIEIPEMANTSIDLLVSYRGGVVYESRNFRKLDANGRATVFVPAVMSPDVFVVKGVRRSGELYWRRAEGRVEVVP